MDTEQEDDDGDIGSQDDDGDSGLQDVVGNAGLQDNVGDAGMLDDNGDAGLQDNAYDDVEGLCVVCMQRTSSTVFQACGHMCTCMSRASYLNSCPLCRSRSRAIRVYHN